MTRLFRVWMLLLLGWVTAYCQAGTTIVRTNYHGWTDAVLLSNGLVEAVVVPAVNRVMQFRFVGEGEGPFWENRQLDGSMPDPEDKSWRNFGGDKSWPAPQSDWPQIMDRSWPPPRAFDPSSATVTIEGSTVVLVSSMDPFFKIRVTRRIRLNPHKPVMHIETEFQQMEPSSRTTGVWVVTQLKHPVRLYLPIPKKSIFPNGYCPMGELPADLRIKNGMISMVRGSVKASKIGNDAGTLLWMGDRMALRIDSPRIRNMEYPDKGCSAEIFTSPDPAYIEMELLGPLSQLEMGRKTSRTSVYTLYRWAPMESASDPDNEARIMLQP